MVELVEREAELAESEHTNILRWEDDGGQAIEYGDRPDRLNPEPAQRNNQAMALPSMGKKDSLHASRMTAARS